MEETTAKNGEVVGLNNISSNVTNSIKGATVKKTEEECFVNSNDVSKVVDIGSKLSTDNIHIVKKDGTLEDYDITKVVKAIKKSAARMLIELTTDEINRICNLVNKSVLNLGYSNIEIIKIHSIVESALEDVNPKVAKSYRDYRNYKIDFVTMLDKVYKESQKIMYVGDKENSNSDSTLVSTKRSLIFNQLNKELYKKFFLNVEELQAARDGYIYIHDMAARRDSMNCCLFDIGTTNLNH